MRDGELIVEGLKDSGCGDAPLSDGMPFTTTGELYAFSLREGEFDGDVLLNYRAALWMIGTEEHEQLLFEGFKKTRGETVENLMERGLGIYQTVCKISG